MVDLVYSALALVGAFMSMYVVVQLLTGSCEVVCQ